MAAVIEHTSERARVVATDGRETFESDLRISPRPVVGLLLVTATLLPLVSGRALPFPNRLSVSLTLFAVSLSAAGLLLWRDRVGRWATVLACVAAIYATRIWLGLSSALPLLSLASALAVGLLGLRQALGITVALSIFLLSLGRGQGIDGNQVAVALIAIWASLGIMHAVYGAVRQLARWAWDYFLQARDLLEEARTRQSELKDALDALAHANRQLALANEKLSALRQIAEEAQKTKAAFVSNVSHEFRTPLNMIIGLVDLLLETPQVYGRPLPPELLEDLEIVHRNCDHLSGMIDDVLDLSQIEVGRLSMHRAHVDLGEIVSQALAVVDPLLKKKALSSEVQIAEDLPTVYCDRTRIRQVILNLVSNAARFTDEGTISIHAEDDGGYVAVRVSDTGPGIAPEDTARIFEPFQQARLGAGRGGSGLGLSISKQFVELHGGSMWLKSSLGVGSTFGFRLPLAPLPGPTAPPQRWITEGWVERKTRTNVPAPKLEQRVIVYDDSGELRPLFARFDDQVEFVGVGDLDEASEAVQRLAAQAMVVNAQTMDQLWSRVTRANARMPDMPIIGCSLPPRASQALRAGAAGYLLKPVKRTELLRLVGEIAPSATSILVVDDDADTQRLLQRMLGIRGTEMEVLSATSGSQAIAAMRSRRPDLVLLDIMMPDMDGWRVLEEKELDGALSDISVIIVSAQDPADEPLSSRLILGSMGKGLSVSKLLRCSRALSSLLLSPD